MSSIRKITAVISLTLPLITFTGCQTTQPEPTKPSTLTAGKVKQSIVKGETSQADILKDFGSPNLMTKNSESKEVWNYSRMSVDSSGESSFSSLLLIGSDKASSSTTTKSFDLIITFDDNDLVQDYSFIASSY